MFMGRRDKPGDDEFKGNCDVCMPWALRAEQDTNGTRSGYDAAVAKVLRLVSLPSVFAT